MRGIAVGFLLGLLAMAPWVVATEPPCSKLAAECIAPVVDAIRKQGYIGLLLRMQESQPGIFSVQAVAPDSPAERAGVRAGDLLVGRNGQRFSRDRTGGMPDYLAGRPLQGVRAGEVVELLLERAGKELHVPVRADTRSEESVARAVGVFVLSELMRPPEGSSSRPPR